MRPRSPRRERRRLLLLGALALIGPRAAAAQEPSPAASSSAEVEQVPLAPVEEAPAAAAGSPARILWTAEGEVSAFLSSRIDYVGSFRIHAALPTAAGAWQLRLGSEIPVLSASGSSALIIDDIDYEMEVGLARAAAGAVWTPVARARGSENVDRPGSRGAVLVGLRVGQAAAHRALDWEVEAAGAVGDWGLGARAALAARGEWRLLRRPQWSAGLRASWDALWLRDPDEVRADAAAGPFLSRLDPEGLLVSVQARYLRARHPLGLEESGLLIGVRVRDQGTRDRAGGEPHLEGALSAGGGNDRVRTQQSLRILSAPFRALRRAWHFRLAADNVLLGARVNDVYYVLEGGMETAEGPARAGIHFHHRSGHLLGEASERRLSLNILELGVRSPGWHPDLPEWPRQRGTGRLSYELRAGGVLSSEFGEHQGWSARGGLRWSLPGKWRRAAPFVGARAQRGEGEGWAVSAGLHTPSALSVMLAAERDSQLVERRDTFWTASVGRRF